MMMMIIIIINDTYKAQIRKKKSTNALLAVKQVCLQLFPEYAQRNVRRMQFSQQTIPNCGAMYSKATASVSCPGTWHKKLAGLGGSQVGPSSV